MGWWRRDTNIDHDQAGITSGFKINPVTGYPGIAVKYSRGSIFSPPVERGVKYYYWDGSSWNVDIVHKTTGSTDTTGRYCTLDYDINGNPNILFNRDSGGDSVWGSYKSGGTWNNYHIAEIIGTDVYYLDMKMEPNYSIHSTLKLQAGPYYRFRHLFRQGISGLWFEIDANQRILDDWGEPEWAWRIPHTPDTAGGSIHMDYGAHTSGFIVPHFVFPTWYWNGAQWATWIRHIVKYGDDGTGEGDGRYYIENIAHTPFTGNVLEYPSIHVSKTIPWANAGAVAIAWVERGAGVYFATNNGAGGWNTTLVDPGQWAAKYTSVTQDAAGAYHMCYMGNAGEFIVANNTSGTWVAAIVDNTATFVQSRADIDFEGNFPQFTLFNESSNRRRYIRYTGGDSGVRGKQLVGAGPATEDVKFATGGVSPLTIKDLSGTQRQVVIVEPGDEAATRFAIQTSSGVKKICKEITL